MADTAPTADDRVYQALVDGFHRLRDRCDCDRTTTICFVAPNLADRAPELFYDRVVAECPGLDDDYVLLFDFEGFEHTPDGVEVRPDAIEVVRVR